MLYLISIGLNSKQITLEALNALRECSEIFLENYTSKFSEGSIKDLEKLIGRKIISLNRIEVEENFSEIHSKAKKENAAVLFYGNVFSATTHIQILLDADEKQIPVKVFPGISVFSYLGKTGLSEYKFGKTVSIARWEKNFKPESFFDGIKENFERGLHTLCLLDIKAEENYFMKASEAIELIEKIDKKKLLNKAKFAALIGMGSENEKIVFGDKNKIKKVAGENIQSLIVCGKLNEKESEALNELSIK